LSFRRPGDPLSIVNAMAEYQATMDALRDGLVNRNRASCPASPVERARHLKAFGYFCDASMVGVGPLPASALLDNPIRNPDIDRLAAELKHKQVKTLASSGIYTIMADLRDSMEAPPTAIVDHDHMLVFLYDMPRDPRPGNTAATGSRTRRRIAPACVPLRRPLSSRTTSGSGCWAGMPRRTRPPVPM
jgi:hypothetical protein